MAIFGLSEQDVEILRELVRRVLREEFNRADIHGGKSIEEFHSKEGLLDGALAVGGSATLSVYTNPSGTWTDSTDNITVKWPSGQGLAVDSGKYIRAVWINGEWRPATGVC